MTQHSRRRQRHPQNSSSRPKGSNAFEVGEEDDESSTEEYTGQNHIELYRSSSESPDASPLNESSYIQIEAEESDLSEQDDEDAYQVDEESTKFSGTNVPVRKFEKLQVGSPREHHKTLPKDTTPSTIPGRMEVDTSMSQDSPTPGLIDEPNMAHEENVIDIDAEEERERERDRLKAKVGEIAFAFLSVEKLPYVEGRMLSGNHNLPSVVNLKDSFPSSNVNRIQKIMAHTGTDDIKNLALCDPSKLSVDRCIRHRDTDPFSMFYICAIIKFCALFDDNQLSRQIGIMPFVEDWYRSVAVVGACFKTNVFFINDFSSVITMSTRTKNYVPSGGQPKQPKSPTSYRRHADATGALDFEATVPVFDGRRGFDLNNLGNLTQMGRELSQGTAVMPIFTMHKFHPYGTMTSKYNIEKNDIILSFNLRAVVVLMSPDNAFSLEQHINIKKQALGVNVPDEEENCVRYKDPNENVFPGASTFNSNAKKVEF